MRAGQRPRRRSQKLLDDRGQAAGAEVLAFGFLVLVAGALLLGNAWAVVDAKLAVTAAVREATRAYVEAPDPGTALRAAEHAAGTSITGHGIESYRLELLVDEGRGFGRCSRVVIEGRVIVEAIGLPFTGGFGHGFEVRATHSEIVDPYRSGLAGAADCEG